MGIEAVQETRWDALEAHRSSDRPVAIVGSGLTGMAISHTLSGAGIRHVVIGGPPGPLPRLGESLNLEGTLLLHEFCGEFSRFFSLKKQAIAYVGDYVVNCEFDISRTRLSRAFFRLLGETAPGEFLHIDRLGLDSAMYERMVASPWCQVRDAKVKAIAFDAASDRVTSLALDDGNVLHPSYVFDATNHLRVVAQAAGVKCTMIGRPQRVVYTHFHPPGRRSPAGPRPACDMSTNLLRLFGPLDGIDAMAWYIPLPGYVSIGASTDAEGAELSDEALLKAVEAGYARRGLEFRERFPEPAPTMSLRHRYFVHERAFGANWLLAGGTYASVWWLAGAGVGTSFVAAKMAADIVADPLGQGRRYQTYLTDLIPIHGTFDWFVYSGLDEVVAAAVQRQCDRFVRTNVSRLAQAAQMRRRIISKAAGRLLSSLVRTEGFLRNYCDVTKAPMAEQTRQVFGPPPRCGDAPTDVDVALQLVEVIAGRAEIGLSERLLDERVVCHLDGISVTGRRAWQTWLRFIRSRRRAPDLELVEVRADVESDGVVRITGRWRTGQTLSGELAARYRIAGGRVVEIWTSRTNYVFVLGRIAATRAGMLLVLGYVAFASRLKWHRPSMRL